MFFSIKTFILYNFVPFFFRNILHVAVLIIIQLFNNLSILKMILKDIFQKHAFRNTSVFILLTKIKYHKIKYHKIVCLGSNLI